jgi:alkanesulfonate monooxygenase SsuD/methylene tetrahydromethanopterin reductase-like flavin-dependent oxidoreductase (luciferase family)
VQQPRPPIYLGGTSRAAIRRAASQGDGFLVPGLGSREEYDAYMAEVEACGKDPSAASYLATNIPMYVTRDHNKAWDDVKHHILYQENVYAQWYMDAGYPDLVGRRLASNANELNREAYLVGSPAYVLERIARHQETVPFTHLGFWAILPGQDPAAALGSLELFAVEVLPHLK